MNEFRKEGDSKWHSHPTQDVAQSEGKQNGVQTPAALSFLARSNLPRQVHCQNNIDDYDITNLVAQLFLIYMAIVF